MSSNLTQGTVGYPNGRGVGLRSRSVRVRIPLPLRSSSPTAETTPSNSEQSRFESGDEYESDKGELFQNSPQVPHVRRSRPTRVAQGIELRSTKPSAVVRFHPWVRNTTCRSSLVVKPLSSKQVTGVRFSLTAPSLRSSGVERPFRNRLVRGSNPRVGSMSC